MGTLTDPVTGERFVYYTRDEWGARPRRYRNSIRSTENGVFDHHSVTGIAPASSIVRAIQNFHMDVRGWSDIAYSFLIAQDGAIYEGRGFGTAGGHTAGFNFTSHALCFIGNSDVDQPTEICQRAGDAVFRALEQMYGAQRSRGHRDVAATGCPGAKVYAELPRPFITSAPTPPPDPDPVPPTPPPADWTARCDYNHWDGAILSTALVDEKRADTAEVQFLLIANGQTVDLDGYYGDETAGEVLRFQKVWNIFAKNPAHRIEEDGEFGPSTAHCLCFVLVKKGLW